MFAAIGAAMSENMAGKADLRELERKLDARMDDLGRRIDKIKRYMDDQERDKERKKFLRSFTFNISLWMIGAAAFATFIMDKLL